MSMTESEAIKKILYMGVGRTCLENEKSVISKALKELMQYRAIGTVSEFRENKNFLEFLHNHILPNEMEQYLTMYHASGEKGTDWSEGKEV